MTDAGTIRITARTLDLAREALADWIAEHPRRALDRVTVTKGGEGVVISALWEYQAAATSDAPDEFRPEPNFLYRYFSEDGYLLYVGMTRQLADRDLAYWDKVWRPLAEYMFVETFPTRELVQSAEYRAYKIEEPHFNCKIPYQPDFSESVRLKWYGKRTGGKWHGTKSQWFRREEVSLVPSMAPEWWSYGRPQLAESTFVDPRIALVMGAAEKRDADPISPVKRL